MGSLKILVPLILTVVIGACARPPRADIEAANAAVATARQDADIVAYAPDTLHTAETKLSEMQAELNARHYDKVKSLALEARTAAETAANDAAKGKEKAQADAATLIETLKRSLSTAARKLAAARRIKGMRLTFSTFAKQLDEAGAALADAEKELDAGNFASALQKATAVQSRLADGQKMITDALAALKR